MLQGTRGRIGVRMEPIWEEVEGLGIVVPRALNPEDLPLTPASGQVVGLTEVQFEYRGPATWVAICWGLKPAGWVDFNNGDGLIPAAWGWHAMALDEAWEWALFTAIRATGMANVVIPYAGDYPLRGGAMGRLNVGTAHTWVWLADYALAVQIAEETYLPVEDFLVDEALILVIDTDADVVELQAPAPPALEARYLETRYELL